MQDLEQHLRETLVTAATQAPTIGADSRDVVGRARRRHHRRARAVAVLAAGTVAAVTLGVVSTQFWTTSGSTPNPNGVAASTGDLTTNAIPFGPLAPRTGAAVTWTPNGMFIWGGANNSKTAPVNYADGAVYDPATSSWQELPRSPLTARSGAVAVWTGNDVVIAGGSDADGASKLPTDVAAYSFETHRWRQLPSIPSGRTFARGLMVSDRLVLAGGSVRGSDPHTLLVFSRSDGVWRQMASSAYVVDAVAQADAVVTISVDPGTRAVELERLNPVTGQRTALPAPPEVSNLQRVGLATGPDGVLVAESTGEQTRLLTLGSATEGWVQKVQLPGDSFAPPILIGFDPQTAPLFWTGGTVLSVSNLGIDVLPLRSGQPTRAIKANARDGHCSSGSAVAWTGSSLLSWSGKGCRSGDLEVDRTAVQVTP